MAFTTPGTAVAGDVLTAAFWNSNVRDNLNVFAPLAEAWTSFTPTIAQGASTNIAKTITYCHYMQVGKTIFAQSLIVMNGTGSAGSAITCTFPVALRIPAFREIGTASYFATGGFKYPLVVEDNNSSTVMRFQYMGRTDDATLGASGGFTGAVSAGQILSFSIMYEAS
jgi:hypothetical protein